jgi:hypothetical protein
MASAWDRAKEMAEKHSGSGMFLRLTNDGDRVVGVFCGDPDPREMHWNGEIYEECTGQACNHCAAGKKPSLRVAINFWLAAENAVKVLEGGTMWFRDVLAVRDKYGLDKWTFEVKRIGKANDPKTRYSILPEERIEPALRVRIDACPLHDLASLGRGDAYEAPEQPGTGTVDDATAKALLGELRALPRPEVEKFFAAFKIGRLRELKAVDVPEVRAYLAHAAGDSTIPF